jgi:hypothetical protein
MTDFVKDSVAAASGDPSIENEVATNRKAGKPVVAARPKQQATDSDPRTRLKQLRADAQAELSSDVGHHDQLRALLAKAYGWWSDVPAETKETLYSESGIKYYKTQDGSPRFNPVVKLIWGFGHDLSPSQNVTVSQRARALTALHSHFLKRPDDFKFNREGALKAHIEKTGGVSGLIADVEPESENEEAARPDPNKPNRSSGLSSTDRHKIQAEIAKLALKQLASSDVGIGKAEVTQPVRIGKDNLLVLLARFQSDTITILGSTNAGTQIDAVAAASAKHLNVQDENLRTLTQVLATQLFPPQALPASDDQRKKWFSKYNEKSDQKNATGQFIPSSKALLIRGTEQDILLSQNRLAVSPVTRCVVAKPWVSEGHSIQLKGGERALLERWIESGEISLKRAKAPKQREHGNNSDKWAFKLALHDSIAETDKDLHFYQLKPHQTQVDFKRNDFRANWSIELSPGWFAKLRQNWTDPWFLHPGKHNQITRPENRKLRLSAAKSDLTVTYDFRGDKFPSTSIPLPEGVAGPADVHPSAYFSKDLAPILFNLADVAATGSVTMAGNRHALVFTYATTSGDFEIAVPTLDADEQARDATAFAPLARSA